MALSTDRMQMRQDAAMQRKASAGPKESWRPGKKAPAWLRDTWLTPLNS